MSDQSHPPNDPSSPRVNTARFVWALMLALALWALYLAIGSLIYRPEQADQQAWLRGIRRSLLILGCVASFLTIWLVLLRSRARRL